MLISPDTVHPIGRLALTSDTSLWQLSTDLVSSCSCVRISHKATVVSRCRSPRCSSSSFADRFMLITLTCFCKLWASSKSWREGRGMVRVGLICVQCIQFNRGRRRRCVTSRAETKSRKVAPGQLLLQQLQLFLLLLHLVVFTLVYVFHIRRCVLLQFKGKYQAKMHFSCCDSFEMAFCLLLLYTHSNTHTHAHTCVCVCVLRLQTT